MSYRHVAVQRTQQRLRLWSMLHCNNHRKASVTIDSITDTIERAFKSAGLEPRSGVFKGVAETIHKALSAAGITQRSPDAQPADAAQPAAKKRVVADWIDAVPLHPRPVDSAAANDPADGEFISRTFSNAAGSRNYRLYVPPGHDGNSEPMPLLLMLHGCKQNPDDFAAGTRMNALAQQHGFLVAYPEQTRAANGSNCWNWFAAPHQSRGGEPQILAGIVGDIAAHYRIDSRRVFVAGLSAGAAMAVILGAAYPEVFAAVGAHSGLPQGAAHDVPSAFAAMHGGAVAPAAVPATQGMPTIVFHGDQDRTVVAANGQAIVGQAFSAHAASPLERETVAGNDSTRSVYRDAAGHVQIEDWLVHGGGHAWSGGSAAGSFTNPRGPDASAEMVRFFLALPVSTPPPIEASRSY